MPGSGWPEIFYAFLKPIINGTGNYYIEARTRNDEQTDMIIGVKEVVLGEKLLIEAVV